MQWIEWYGVDVMNDKNIQTEMGGQQIHENTSDEHEQIDVDNCPQIINSPLELLTLDQQEYGFLRGYN